MGCRFKCLIGIADYLQDMLAYHDQISF
jgi:hypothetical protein